MTTTKLMSMLRAAIFTGTVGLIPGAALADSGPGPNRGVATAGVPDHAQAEQRGAEGDAISAAAAKANAGALDHAQAQARGDRPTSSERHEAARGSTTVPDHAEAQGRVIGGATQ